MGYKKAGFDVVGNVEIDAGMQKLYARNLHTKHSFTMDIRDFNQLENLPDEIIEPDILDGSPPCTTFSTVGKREKSWGIERRFNEGAKVQRLDDLFLEFLRTVKKLRPRIVIAENVLGLFTGNARGYVHEILQGFHALNYRVQIFKLDASRMSVPQKRIRFFIIATRENFPPLHLSFQEPPILFGQMRTAHGIPLQKIA